MLRTNRQTDRQTDELEYPTHATDIVGVGNDIFENETDRMKHLVGKCVK